jgi:hypothetical protein
LFTVDRASPEIGIAYWRSNRSHLAMLGMTKRDLANALDWSRLDMGGQRNACGTE